MARMVRVLVQHGLIPQPRRRLDLTALSLVCWWLVWGSGVVGIGLCTRELYWDPLARVIASRPLERGLWAGIEVSDGGQLACCSLCTQQHGPRIVRVPCPLCPACLCPRVECVAFGAAAGSETHATTPETHALVPLHALLHA